MPTLPAEDEFLDVYMEYCDKHEDLSELNEQERNLHIKYIQLKYKTDENIKDDETIDEYETRIASKNSEQQAPQIGF